MTDIEFIINLLSNGNPGAKTVLKKLYKKNESYITTICELKIYGSSIWILYKKKCQCNIDTFITAIENLTTGKDA